VTETAVQAPALTYRRIWPTKVVLGKAIVRLEIVVPDVLYWVSLLPDVLNVTVLVVFEVTMGVVATVLVIFGSVRVKPLFAESVTAIVFVLAERVMLPPLMLVPPLKLRLPPAAVEDAEVFIAPPEKIPLAKVEILPPAPPLVMSDALPPDIVIVPALPPGCPVVRHHAHRVWRGAK
jgi:hypothetical protein